jgi:hypothetical protein
VHSAGLYAQQQGKEARHHEPLNVVRIAELERLVDDLAQAIQVRLPGPKECRQRLGRLELVHFEVAGHEAPVDAAHAFAPAEDLPDETFHRRQRGAAFTIGPLGGGDGVTRVEQLQIHRGREARVIKSALHGSWHPVERLRVSQP